MLVIVKYKEDYTECFNADAVRRSAEHYYIDMLRKGCNMKHEIETKDVSEIKVIHEQEEYMIYKAVPTEEERRDAINELKFRELMYRKYYKQNR